MTPLPSFGAPTTAVVPSAESATVSPKWPGPDAPAAVSFGPCCVHTPFARVNVQTAPTLPLSPGPPMSAVFPSADSATS